MLLQVQQPRQEPWVLEVHQIIRQAAEPPVAVVEDTTEVAEQPAPIAVQVRVAEAHPGPELSIIPISRQASETATAR